MRIATIVVLPLALGLAGACSGSSDSTNTPADGGAGSAGSEGGATGGFGGGAGGGGGGGVCTPGFQIACSCLGGAQGAQTCKSDGSGYDPCLCAEAGAGGSGGIVTGGSAGNVAGAAGVGGDGTAGTGGTGVGGTAGLGGADAGGSGQCSYDPNNACEKCQAEQCCDEWIACLNDQGGTWNDKCAEVWKCALDCYQQGNLPFADCLGNCTMDNAPANDLYTCLYIDKCVTACQ